MKSRAKGRETCRSFIVVKQYLVLTDEVYSVAFPRNFLIIPARKRDKNAIYERRCIVERRGFSGNLDFSEVNRRYRQYCCRRIVGSFN